jgi:hypothetical protein
MNSRYLLNGQQIVHIIARDKRKADDLEFVPGHWKSRWFGLKKEWVGDHFYDKAGAMLQRIWTKEQLETNYYSIKLLVEDNVAYYKPYVYIRFTNGERTINLNDWQSVCDVVDQIKTSWPMVEIQINK